MSGEDFDDLVRRRCDLIKAVLTTKAGEYASVDDRFHNFKNSVGLSFHTGPEKIAWEFAVKHFRSLKDIMDHVETGYNGYPTEDMIEEKIGDAINYLILIEGMIKERIREHGMLKNS